MMAIRIEDKIERAPGGEERRRPVVITTAKKDLSVLKAMVLRLSEPIPFVFPSGFEMTIYPSAGRKAIEDTFRKLKYRRGILYAAK
jgi:hypothetical protein